MSGEAGSLARRVLGAGAAITTASVTTQLIGFLATPVSTRMFSPDVYGAAASVGAAVGVFSALSLGPIDMGYARFGLSNEVERAEVERFCWQFGMALSLAIMLAAGLVWHVLLASTLRLPATFSLAILAGVGAGTLSSLSATRRRLEGRFRRIAFANGVSGLAAAVVPIALGWLWRTDAWPLLLSAAAAPLLQAVALGLPRPSLLFKRATLPSGMRRRILVLGLPSLLTMPAYWAIASSDRWFLTGMAGQHAAGIYSVAFALGMVGIAVNSALSTAWFPEVVRLANERGANAQSEVGRTWSRLVVMLGIVWLAVASAGGDVIRLLTPVAFHPAASLVPWIAAGSFFYGVAALAGAGLFVSGNVVAMGTAWATAGALSIATNAFLIPRQGPAGAAFTVAMSFAVVAGMVLVASQRRWAMRIPWGRLVAILLGLLACGLGMAAPWHDAALVSVSLKIIPGALAAVVGMASIAPDWFPSIGRIRFWSKPSQ